MSNIGFSNLLKITKKMNLCYVEKNTKILHEHSTLLEKMFKKCYFLEDINDLKSVLSINTIDILITSLEFYPNNSTKIIKESINNKNINIIVTSLVNNELNNFKKSNIKCNFFITKPFTQIDLMQNIFNLIKNIPFNIDNNIKRLISINKFKKIKTFGRFKGLPIQNETKILNFEDNEITIEPNFIINNELKNTGELILLIENKEIKCFLKEMNQKKIILFYPMIIKNFNFDLTNPRLEPTDFLVNIYYCNKHIPDVSINNLSLDSISLEIPLNHLIEKNEIFLIKLMVEVYNPNFQKMKNELLELEAKTVKLIKNKKNVTTIVVLNIDHKYKDIYNSFLKSLEKDIRMELKVKELNFSY